MPLKVVEIHHHAVRIKGNESALSAHLEFYEGLLGLKHDQGRPNLPGIPGFWINVGEVGQIHLIGGAQPSSLSRGPEQDPAAPHVALAVEDIAEAKAELDRSGTQYWSIAGVVGPKAEQIFLRDPAGNMVELHQFDQCRCRAVSRK